MAQSDDLYFRRVFDAFIEPLQKIFNKTISDFLAKEYAEELKDYDKRVLNHAMTQIKRNQKYFPTIAHCIEACDDARNFLNTKRAVKHEDGFIYPWEETAQQAQVMIWDYIANFKQVSQIWMEAVAEGWDSALHMYVHNVAYYQAQIITGQKNIGYSSEIFVNPQDEGERKSMLHDLREQAKTGLISVPIPTGKIIQFRRYRRPLNNQA